MRLALIVVTTIAVGWMPVLALAAQQPARIALLIGNQGYMKKVGLLKNPHNDVDLVAAALRRVGFQATIVKDANYRKMDVAIRRYVRRLRRSGPGTVGMFYYSGHGVANPETQSNYLIPVDVENMNDADIWFQAFEQRTIIDRLSRGASEATHYLVFDACRNELNITGSAGKSLGSNKGFVPIAETAGLLIAYATAPGKTASDEGENGGIYAKALAAELVKPNVEAVTMFRNVQIRVKRAINQDPWLSFPALPPVYFGGQQTQPPPKNPRPTNARPIAPLSHAAIAWMMVKDTKSVAVLDAFAKEHQGSVFATLARERIIALSRKTEDLDPTAKNRFDGRWSGYLCSSATRKHERRCRKKIALVHKGRFLAAWGTPGQPGSGTVEGRITETGKIDLTISGVSAAPKLRGKKYLGRLDGKATKTTISLKGTYNTGRGIAFELQRASAAQQSLDPSAIGPEKTISAAPPVREMRRVLWHNGGLCRDNNIDHCRALCKKRGFARACSRLRALLRSKRARRGGLCADGNVDHCRGACRRGFKPACARLRAYRNQKRRQTRSK